jgi:hypothetical protein
MKGFTGTGLDLWISYNKLQLIALQSEGLPNTMKKNSP